MTSAELVALAASLPTPVDPAFGPCRAYVEEHRGAWRLAFARDGGRISEPAGPAFSFDRAGGRDARALVALVNARLGPAPRRAAPDLARTPGGGAGEQGLARPSEAPVAPHALAEAAVRPHSPAQAPPAWAGDPPQIRALDVAGILADHVADVIAACTPKDPAPAVAAEDRADHGHSAQRLLRRSDPARDPASRAQPLSPGLFAGG